MPQPTLDDALAGYRRFHRALMNSSARKWRDIDISMQQMRAMHVLRDEGEVPVGRLAEVFGFGMPAASLLSDRLVRAGYAERHDDPADRRRVMIRLSRAGDRLMNELIEGSHAHMRRWMATLSPAELDTVARAWHLMAEAATGERERATV
jgi:DNA-binding MarR family transcriptional regulator